MLDLHGVRRGAADPGAVDDVEEVAPECEVEEWRPA